MLGCECILSDVADNPQHWTDDNAIEAREEQKDCQTRTEEYWDYLHGSHSLGQWQILLLLLGWCWLSLPSWSLAYPNLPIILQLHCFICLLWCGQSHANKTSNTQVRTIDRKLYDISSLHSRYYPCDQFELGVPYVSVEEKVNLEENAKHEWMLLVITNQLWWCCIVMSSILSNVYNIVPIPSSSR